MDRARVRCRAVRTLLLPLVAALVLTGCSASPAPTPTAVDDELAVLDDLGAEVAAVAEGQATADRQVNAVLDAVRAVDEAVVELERPASFDDALAAYPDRVHPEVEAVDATGLREGYLEVADAVDAARQALASARDVLDDEWEVRYLDAQDRVLLAVRDHAWTADRLAQLLEQHWPTYVEVDARVTDFAARRGNYRDTQEATDALAVELDTVLDDLAVAEAQISEYRTRRTAAAQAVNDATADAVSVYEQRPTAGT